jgi:DNA processing protein
VSTLHGSDDAATRAAGVWTCGRGDEGYPARLADDPKPPAVLFGRGDLAALDGPQVAIVGSRRCTPYGRDVARQLGRELAAAGVGVVSGLALGIDGAAHEGALAAVEGGAGGAPPVGVVASGLDVVYPWRHRGLWEGVASAGVLLSEAPLGTPPERWRFPARNRIMAALADVVVVVESHLHGGSRHTVDAALARGRAVMAVPGSVRSPASAGTNALLAEGVAPARDTLDVLVALGLAGHAPLPRRSTSTALRAGTDRRPRPTGLEAGVLDALGWEPATVDQLVDRTGASPGAVAVAVARLDAAGWLHRDGPCWAQVPGGGEER